MNGLAKFYPSDNCSICLQVLKVWDTEDHCCLQTLHLSFPSFSVLGKVVEFGNRSLYPGPSPGATVQPSDSDVWLRGQLLVACCDYVALLRVQTARDCATPPPLPPPSREHHASIPSPWTVADARGLVTPDLPSSLDESDSRYEASCLLLCVCCSSSVVFSLSFLLRYPSSSFC
jgi:hypothetical protein